MLKTYKVSSITLTHICSQVDNTVDFHTLNLNSQILIQKSPTHILWKLKSVFTASPTQMLTKMWLAVENFHPAVSVSVTKLS